MIALLPAAGPAPSVASGGDVFALAERRLAWLDQRQRVLAQNIANVNTPDYVPRDVTPFGRLVSGALLAPARTDARHLAGAGADAGGAVAAEIPAERAPDGNAVGLDTELEKVAQDESDAAVAGNLWKTTMGLYLAALGRGGS